MKLLAERLARLQFLPCATSPGLTLMPIVSGAPLSRFYLTLDEGLEGGTVAIEEVSPGGAVPELRVRNGGELGCVMLDGEELVGGKQDRIINVTVVLPAGVAATIPVSCIEAGRWQYRSARFGTSRSAFFARGRASKLRNVAASLALGGTRRSNQGEVWERIDRKFANLSVERCETGAAAGLYDKLDGEISRTVEAEAPVPGQIGAAFLVDGKVIGIEILRDPDLYAKLAPKLISSYALEAFDPETRELIAANDAPSPRALLDAAIRAPSRKTAGVADGEELHFDSGSAFGAAVIAGGEIVHLSVFPAYAAA